MMYASFLTFVVAAYLVATVPGDLSYVRWFEIESVNEIHGKIVGEAWELFKIKHNKQYENTEEEAYRRSVFIENMKKIDIHNEKYKKGEKSYWLGVNQFSDLKAEEFRALHSGGINMKVNLTGTTCSRFLPPHNVMLPDTVDWREKGYVTPVKNQACWDYYCYYGLVCEDIYRSTEQKKVNSLMMTFKELQLSCRSCWAFSATGSLEGQNFRKTGKLISLSEQQLVDCSFRNFGCRGGWMDQAFDYIKMYGIETEKEYPYKAEDQQCKYNSAKVVAKNTGCVDIKRGSESALQQAVATVGPISVAIDANHSSFQHYSGGVYEEDECSSTKLDHGVLAVGYGTENGNDYWLVKNSWSEGWGDNGYVKMARNKGNMCGIATASSFPLV